MANTLKGRRAVVITVSDRCSAGTQIDVSGPKVAELLREAGFEVNQHVLPDEREAIAAALREYSAKTALILTTGGTGLAARDVTPEATLVACDRMVPGLAELIRAEGAKETRFAALGRGVCGVSGSCLILNLPGSPKGAVSATRTVLPLLEHALDLLADHTEHHG